MNRAALRMKRSLSGPSGGVAWNGTPSVLIMFENSRPSGPAISFFVYADCSFFSDDADQFTRDLLNEANVVIVPGLDFGSTTARQYVRISYATSMENLEEAVRRIGDFLRRKSDFSRSAI